MNIKNYYGKDWKFFWTTSKLWNIIVQKPCNHIGLKLINTCSKTLARKLLRIGKNHCSWCGDSQNKNTGLFMAYSRKGLRCSNKNCMDKPYV